MEGVNEYMKEQRVHQSYYMKQPMKSLVSISRDCERSRVIVSVMMSQDYVTEMNQPVYRICLYNTEFPVKAQKNGIHKGVCHIWPFYTQG